MTKTLMFFMLLAIIITGFLIYFGFHQYKNKFHHEDQIELVEKVSQKNHKKFDQFIVTCKLWYDSVHSASKMEDSAVIDQWIKTNFSTLENEYNAMSRGMSQLTQKLDSNASISVTWKYWKKKYGNRMMKNLKTLRNKSQTITPLEKSALYTETAELIANSRSKIMSQVGPLILNAEKSASPGNKPRF